MKRLIPLGALALLLVFATAHSRKATVTDTAYETNSDAYIAAS